MKWKIIFGTICEWPEIANETQKTVTPYFLTLKRTYWLFYCSESKEREREGETHAANIGIFVFFSNSFHKFFSLIHKQKKNRESKYQSIDQKETDSTAQQKDDFFFKPNTPHSHYHCMKISDFIFRSIVFISFDWFDPNDI